MLVSHQGAELRRETLGTGYAVTQPLYGGAILPLGAAGALVTLNHSDGDSKPVVTVHRLGQGRRAGAELRPGVWPSMSPPSARLRMGLDESESQWHLSDPPEQGAGR